MKESVKMVISDPSKFALLATQVKLDMIQAAQATVNVMAARGRQEAIKNIQGNLILRNNFTVRQIQYTPSTLGKYAQISSIQSVLGATQKAAYMERQETGGTRTPASGSALAIPTDAARGGSRRSAVAKKNYLMSLKKKIVYTNFHNTSGRGGPTVFYAKSPALDTVKQRLIRAAAVAYKKRMMLHYNKGLYSVNNFIKSGRNEVSFNLDLIYNFRHRHTFTPENKWLLPAGEKVASQAQGIFNSQMKKLEN